MRNGHQNKHQHQHQHHRMRGRNRGGGKSHNPLTRVYESNGPDVKIRGTANHVAEKYIQLARDATASGDPVAAENYYQHAEHYFRLIAAAQEQLRQSQPYPQQRDGDTRAQDDTFGEGDDDTQPFGEPHSPREQQQQAQPYQRDQQQQPYPPREPQPRHETRQPAAEAGDDANIDRLPSFITGGQPQPGAGNGQQNGHDNPGGDRFPLHRRRRRGHRSPRPDMAGGGQGGDDSAPAGE
jgi:hypothetical protein